LDLKHDGTYPGKGDKVRFKAYIGGWLAKVLVGNVPLASQEMTVQTTNGYARQTVSFYIGILDSSFIKPIK